MRPLALDWQQVARVFDGPIALVVENYDDAIEFYTKKLQFTVAEDTDVGGGKRWVQVSPPNSNGTNLLLAQFAALAPVGRWDVQPVE